MLHAECSECTRAFAACSPAEIFKLPWLRYRLCHKAISSPNRRGRRPAPKGADLLVLVFMDFPCELPFRLLENLLEPLFTAEEGLRLLHVGANSRTQCQFPNLCSQN